MANLSAVLLTAVLLTSWYNSNVVGICGTTRKIVGTVWARTTMALMWESYHAFSQQRGEQQRANESHRIREGWPSGVEKGEKIFLCRAE
jgi:hypothetical protein